MCQVVEPNRSTKRSVIEKNTGHVIMKKSSFILVWWLLIELLNSNHGAWLSSKIHLFKINISVSVSSSFVAEMSKWLIHCATLVMVYCFLFLVSCYGSLNIFHYTNMENLSNNQELLQSVISSFILLTLMECFSVIW